MRSVPSGTAKRILVFVILPLVLIVAAFLFTSGGVTVTQIAMLSSKTAIVLGDDPDEFTAAWDKFCDDLKVTGRSIAGLSTADNTLDRAEGYRYMLRMLRLGLLAELENADVQYPQIWESETATMKSAANNPDELYHDLIFDGNETYRIIGDRGNTPLIEFTVYEGRLGSSETSKTVGHISEQELIVEPDGSFEVILSQDYHDGNWIKTTPGSNTVLIRQYRFDWDATIPASMTVVREAPASRSPNITIDQLVQGLGRTSEFVDRSLQWWSGVSRLMSLRVNNAFMPPIVGETSEIKDVTLPQGHILQPGVYNLQPDEALIIEFDPPDGLIYWGFAVYNWWQENLDYRHSNVHTNNFRAIAGDDGSVRIVVSSSDPGVDNWVDITDHRKGSMLFRWTRPPKDILLPDIKTTVVKVADL